MCHKQTVREELAMLAKMMIGVTVASLVITVITIWLIGGW